MTDLENGSADRMKTEIVTDDLAGAARILRRGGLVAVPTETVYGLAGNALDREAVAQIYEVKGRPEVKPLSIMVPGESAMDAYCEDVPPQARLLARKFWPGPLTIVLRSGPLIPQIVRAGGGTVGLRCPDHPLTLELLRQCGIPLAAPSANLSGAPSPKTAGDVLAYFDGKIDAVIDGGACGIGRESTIIGMAGTPYRIFRPGALPEETIADALAEGMCILGITGGTGAGKTTALDVLREMGALVLDCDELYHRLADRDPGLRRELTERFGAVYPDGHLDRKALGQKVFGDPAALAELDAVTYRYVDAEVTRLLRLHAMSGGTLAAVDAIGLVESGLAARCRRTYAVTAPAPVRVRRIMEREGIPETYARARVQAQKPEEYYRSHCSAVLENAGTREEFAARCRAEFTEVLKNGEQEN